MKLPQLAIRNHQFTLVMMLLLVLLGIVSFFTMPRSEDPLTRFPASSVVAVYPGTNPTDLERMVADPIEEAINELDDIREVQTTIRDGLVAVFVQFLISTDPDEKFKEVEDAVYAIRDELPEDLALLDVEKQNTLTVSIFQAALVSETADYRTLQRTAERLERSLERVGGVKQVDVWAYPEQQVEVALDFEKMREIGLSLNQVVQAIQASSANIPGGHISSGDRRFSIRTSGDYASLDDIRRTVVHARGTGIVYLGDLARVDFDYEDEAYHARFNGRRAVFLTVIQRPETNIFDVMDGVRAELAAFAPRLPEGVALETVFDQSISVAARVNGFFSNLLQGLLLVGLVVLLALGLRASAIVMTAIPLSIFIAVGWVDFSGFGLQQMSIVGLVIALGLLVDNAIVVTENVSRFLKPGASGAEAAVRGTSQIGWAVVSSTATTILAFVPMLLLDTSTGDFIRSMPVTVVFALAASLLVSLTLTPYLASRYLRPPDPDEPRKGRGVLKGWLERVVDGPYRRALRGAVARPGRVMTAAVVVFAASMGLFPLVGVSLFPKADKAQFMIDVDTPEGTSLDHTDRVARLVEAELDRREDVLRYATNVGRGNPRIYYNEIPKNETPTHAQLFVEMRDPTPSRRTALVEDLRETLDAVPGASFEVREFVQGPPVEAPVEIKIFGENLDVLADLAAGLEAVIASTPGTVNVDNSAGQSKTDLHVNINRDKAGLLGVPLVDVDRTVRASVAGLPVATYRDSEGQEYDLLVRLPVADRPAVSDFDRISVSSVTGARIPLRQVAAIELQSGPNRIEHFNFQRAVTVTADVRDGYNVAAVTAEILDAIEDRALPPGYRYFVGGEQESRDESFGGLGQALLLALLGIFGVLVLQFRSFRQPMIVFAAIPFAITGAVLALLLTGYTFSFTAFIGLTSLVGIVVNNSIILVDYANQLRAEGRTVVEAVREAGETRFTPIVLTTLTTIGALLPLTLSGSTLWSPFGWALIGGLLVSTVLTLFVVPALYRLLTPQAA